MVNSSTVSPGDNIIASQYNNLREDVIDTSTGHRHNGTDSRLIVSDIPAISEVATFSLTNSTTTYQDTGLSVSITPLRTSGKILVMFRCHYSVYSQNNEPLGFIVDYDGSNESESELIGAIATSVTNVKAYMRGFVSLQYIITGCTVATHTIKIYSKHTIDYSGDSATYTLVDLTLHCMELS